jgi:hypothetical protein
MALWTQGNPLAKASARARAFARADVPSNRASRRDMWECQHPVRCAKRAATAVLGAASRPLRRVLPRKLTRSRVPLQNDSRCVSSRAGKPRRQIIECRRQGASDTLRPIGGPGTRRIPYSYVNSTSAERSARCTAHGLRKNTRPQSPSARLLTSPSEAVLAPRGATKGRVPWTPGNYWLAPSRL